MPKIILFNGPPRCGKDAAALFCWRQLDNRYYKVFDRISMPIKKAFAGLVAENIDALGRVAGWESCKDEPSALLHGGTYREWQINFSEEFMKDFYSETIFAELFIDRMKRQHADSLVFVPDCGFDVEYHTLAREYGIENVLVVKIFRDGCTFQGDSRSYLSTEGIKGTSFTNTERNAASVVHLTNNGTQDDFERLVLHTVKQWLGDSI